MIDEFKAFNIRARAVLIDYKYKFPDGVCKPKWIILLSDNLPEENIIFTLTTSQVGTYTGSFKDYLIVKKTDDECFDKDCIIEIERTDIIDANLILKKCKSNDIIHKGFISEKLFRQILEKIAECYSINNIIKDKLKVYD